MSVLSATLAPSSRFKSAVFYIASKRQDKEVEYNVSVYKFSNPVCGDIHYSQNVKKRAQKLERRAPEMKSFLHGCQGSL